MFNRVIAGFDGFDGGRDAIALAAALRPKHLTVLMAYGPQMSVAPPTIDRHWDALVPDAERYVAAASAEAGRDDAETRIVNASSAAQALQQAAIDEDADLLVIGSAHHGPLGRLLVGDVGAAVLQGAPGTFTLLNGQELKAGRDPNQCGIVIHEPRISGVHATLKLENGQLLVRDENSNNGTLINNVRLTPAVWSPVPSGSLLRLGPVELSVRLQ